MEDGKERMVKTPWFEHAIPFHEAARIGTQKVIEEHSTIGLVITSDGSFGELPRENFLDAEEKTIQELKKQQKPFLVLVNSQLPYKEEALKTAEEIQEKYQVTALTVNCDQLRKKKMWSRYHGKRTLRISGQSDSVLYSEMGGNASNGS